MIFQSSHELHDRRLEQGWIEVKISSYIPTDVHKVWLNEQVGRRVHHADMSDDSNNGEWDLLKVYFVVIKNPTKALLFKLTYG